MPLSEIKVRRAKPAAKNRKLFDSRGLYLLVAPTGSKYWRFKYRWERREKLLALGVYPEVSLREARDRRDEARRKLAERRDPSSERKAVKKPASATGSEDAFAAVAREWLAKRAPNWVPTHTATIVARLERYVFPTLGGRPVGEITAPEILEVLRTLEARGTVETAHRVHQIIGQVLAYAVALGRATRNASVDLRGALVTRRVRHHAAITDPREISGLMRAIKGYSGSLTVRAALQLSALTFVRSGELRRATWAEVDLDSATWRIPAERMKMRTEHIVPLSRQSVEVLRELQRVTGAGKYIFPGGRTAARPMSENGITAALRAMGYEQGKMTAHGFRTMASTQLNEMGFRGDWIERQLAHCERDGVRAAYNSAEYLSDRRRMMQEWADHLDHLARGSQTESPSSPASQ